MTDQEAHAQAFENGRQQGDKEGYERGLRETVRHGRWVKPPRHKTHCKCSNCGVYPIRGVPNYCPNCGARMDGGADHDR